MWRRLFPSRRKIEKAAVNLALRLASDGRRDAIYDRATGLYAYGYLSLRAQEEIDRAQRGGGSLSLVSLWIEGDAAIEIVASSLLESLDQYDMAGYLSNGHVVLVLLQANAIRAAALLHRAVGDSGATILAGIATFPEDGDTFQSLLTKAKARAERPRWKNGADEAAG